MQQQDQGEFYLQLDIQYWLPLNPLCKETGGQKVKKTDDLYHEQSLETR